MSRDPVLAAFIESCDEEVPCINRESAVVQIARQRAGDPPYRFKGVLEGVEHFERAADGTFPKVRHPIPFEVEIEEDYCRSTDKYLPFRVVRTASAIVHPNIASGVCCLGNKFRPATPLPAVIEQFYQIASGRIAATDDPFDHDAAEFFLNNLEAVRALRAEPLWLRSIDGQARVEERRQAASVDAQEGGA